MIHIGIDPGIKGGIAVIDEQGELAQLMPYKPETLVKLWVGESCKGYHVTIEKAAAFPGQGVVGMFNYGKGAGVIEGILIALAIPYDLVAPGRWHSEMLHGAEGATAKARAWARAQQLFPNNVEWFRKPRGGVHDGLVDAALIAEFSRRSSGR